METNTEWWALLGPVPSSVPAGIIPVPHDRSALLDSSYRLGPLGLHPGEKRLVEYHRTEPDQLVGVRMFESWPVIVKGLWPSAARDGDGLYAKVASMTDQDPRRRVVAHWLHRAACLVSLAFREAWQVRSMAQDVTRLPARVPDSWLAPPPMQDDLDDGLAPTPRGLPAWSLGAWGQLESDRRLAAALTAWHQGLLLAPDFPSYALIAFCGAIEALAQAKALRKRVDVHAEPCPECGSIPKAEARFWATVGLVRDGSEVASLRGGLNPYDRRSHTAHGVAVHGIEDIFGYTHMLIYEPPMANTPGRISMDMADPTQQFMWRDLPAIRAIATDLLLLVLQGGDGGTAPNRDS